MERRPGWAWRQALERLRTDLKSFLRLKALRVEHQGFTDENLWLVALAVAGRPGSHSVDPIELSAVQDALAHFSTNEVIKLRDRAVYADQLQARIAEHAAAGKTNLQPPGPLPDLEMQGGWIWNPYTNERQLERVQAVYAAALSLYERIVTHWFPKLRDRMPIAVTLPGRLVGDFFPSRWNESDHPLLNWHLEPLANGPSRAEIAMGDRHHRHEWPRSSSPHGVRVQQELSRLRPEAAGWLSATFYSSGLNVFEVAPLGTIVYDWLESDLKRTKWNA